MTPETLMLVGESLYGPLWQSELARALGVAQETVNRARRGKRPIPEGWSADLLHLIAERRSGLLEAEAAIHAERVLTIAREQLAETGQTPASIDLTSSEGLPQALLDRVAARLRAAGLPA